MRSRQAGLAFRSRVIHHKSHKEDTKKLKNPFVISLSSFVFFVVNPLSQLLIIVKPHLPRFEQFGDVYDLTSVITEMPDYMRNCI
jgi:hypothetical protein